MTFFYIFFIFLNKQSSVFSDFQTKEKAKQKYFQLLHFTTDCFFADPMISPNCFPCLNVTSIATFIQTTTLEKLSPRQMSRGSIPAPPILSIGESEMAKLLQVFRSCAIFFFLCKFTIIQVFCKVFKHLISVLQAARGSTSCTASVSRTRLSCFLPVSSDNLKCAF